MAKASWCNVSPMSGKRDGILTISAGAHTGRVARNTVVTVTAANGTKPSASIAVSRKKKTLCIYEVLRQNINEIQRRIPNYR